MKKTPKIFLTSKTMFFERLIISSVKNSQMRRLIFGNFQGVSEPPKNVEKSPHLVTLIVCVNFAGCRGQDIPRSRRRFVHRFRRKIFVRLRKTPSRATPVHPRGRGSTPG